MVRMPACRSWAEASPCRLRMARSDGFRISANAAALFGVIPLEGESMVFGSCSELVLFTATRSSRHDGVCSARATASGVSGLSWYDWHPAGSSSSSTKTTTRRVRRAGKVVFIILMYIPFHTVLCPERRLVPDDIAENRPCRKVVYLLRHTPDFPWDTTTDPVFSSLRCQQAAVRIGIILTIKYMDLIFALYPPTKRGRQAPQQVDQIVREQPKSSREAAMRGG